MIDLASSLRDGMLAALSRRVIAARTLALVPPERPARLLVGLPASRVPHLITHAVAPHKPRSFSLLAAIQQKPSRPPAIAAMLAPVPDVSTAMLGAPAAVTVQVRFKKGNRRQRKLPHTRFSVRPRTRGRTGADNNAQWWQPLLPALAAKKYPHEHLNLTGSIQHRKEVMKRWQQSFWHAAIRKEGARRNKLFKQAKREREQEKVHAVYRQYGEILRQRALEQQAAAGPKADDEVTGSGATAS